MIKEGDRIVAKYIKSGDYFRDAYEWYAVKYISNFIVRSAVLFGLIVVSIGLFVIYQVASADSVKVSYPFPIFAFDQTSYYPFIKSLTTEGETVEQSFSRYLVSTYLNYREGYNYRNFVGSNKNILMDKIRVFSSKKVMREYLDYIDPENNADSPMVLYKNRVVRTISINKVEFVKSNFAKIHFKATEKGGDNEKISNWMAEINFQLDDLDKALKRKDKINFTVLNYKSYSVN